MKRKILSYFCASGMLMFIFACGDSFLDVNDNPNQAISSTAELTLTNALNVTAARLSPNEIGAFWSGQWSPSGSVSGFTAEKTYDIQTNFRTTVWTDPYNNLQDYKYVEEAALKDGKQSLAGMARVMKAFNYQLIVDAYNNAPYSDALKGTVSIRPLYDDASAVYDSLIRDLNVGIEYLSVPIDLVSNVSAGAADIYFQGDTDLWVKFANTLKLRILLRQINVSSKATFIAAELAKLPKEAAGFLVEDENVLSDPGYIKSSGKMNPWYENYGFTSADARSGSHDFYVWTKYFLDKLMDYSDTRIARLAYPIGGTYVGVPFGEGSDTYLYPKVSGFGPALLPNDLPANNTVGSSDLYKRPQVILTAAESFFLQAEAVQRGVLTSDLTAKELYEAGITESFKFLDVHDDDAGLDAEDMANDYYNQGISNVSWDDSADKLEAIATQKWIALAGFNGFEAWTEYRRTGFPSDMPLSTRALGNIPVRLLYPLSEYSNNADNALKQGTISQYTSKIFWMK